MIAVEACKVWRLWRIRLADAQSCRKCARCGSEYAETRVIWDRYDVGGNSLRKVDGGVVGVEVEVEPIEPILVFAECAKLEVLVINRSRALSSVS